MSAALALIGGGAAVAVVATQKPAPAPTRQTASGAVQLTKPPSGASVTSGGMTVGTSATFRSKRQMLMGTVASGVVGVSPTSGFGSVVSPTNGVDPMLQQKLDEIEGYAKAAYTNLDKAAKDAAAKALNEELKLDPPLTGDESWEKLSGVLGGAIGAAALGWIPGGAVLGTIVGAYLGVELAQLVSKNIDEIKEWFGSKWADIESWVSGVGGDIEDAAEAVADYIGGWF